MFGAKGQSPAHYTSSLIRTLFPRLVGRGMKMRKVSDNELLLEDIDEWLWTDQQTLQRESKYELCFDIYACSSNGIDTLRGLVVGVSVTPAPRMLLWWKLLLAVAACMVLLFWMQAIYFANVVQASEQFHQYICDYAPHSPSPPPPPPPPTGGPEFDSGL